jgi:predicted transcriptional regulator
MKAIHNISKEAREEIISELLSHRSRKELADELGITPAAIVKFSSGKTHPSDETIMKALKIANDDEKKKILRIIVNDLVSSIVEILSNNPTIAEENLEELKKIITEIDKKSLSSFGFV